MSDRETELQADNTRLITELRMVRAQLNAAKAIMRVGFIERPMSQLMPPTGATCEDLVKLYERIELLEKDAWTMTGPLARQFVKAVRTFDPERNDLDTMVEEWAAKFAKLVGDGD